MEHLGHFFRSGLFYLKYGKKCYLQNRSKFQADLKTAFGKLLRSALVFYTMSADRMANGELLFELFRKITS
jgi:hypothetical protein